MDSNISLQLCDVDSGSLHKLCATVADDLAAGSGIDIILQNVVLTESMQTTVGGLRAQINLKSLNDLKSSITVCTHYPRIAVGETWLVKFHGTLCLSEVCILEIYQKSVKVRHSLSEGLPNSIRYYEKSDIKFIDRL